MATDTIKIRAKVTGGVTEVKALIKHPMETGLVKDKKTGEVVPAHFIKDIKCDHNGKTVMQCDWGIAVSKNPYLSFRFKGGNAGDAIAVSWSDNKGDTDSASDKIE